MGNSNEVVAQYVSEEEFNQILISEKLLRETKKKILLTNIDGRFWNCGIDTKTALQIYNHMMNYEIGSWHLTILRIRYLYSWYSNSKC